MTTNKAAVPGYHPDNVNAVQATAQNADTTKITPASMLVDERGQKLEAEQAPIERKILVNAAASMSGSGDKVGQIPASIVTSNIASQFARNVSRNCSTCKHFDQHAMRKMIALSDSPAAPLAARESVNAIRAQLLMTSNAELLPPIGQDGDYDVEASLKNDLGLCRILTEVEKEDIGMHKLAFCPDQFRSAMKPDGMWAPKDTHAGRSAAKGYDAIMRMAQGKK